MSQLAPTAPAGTDLLCEGCGYILAGLPETANCPECGRPLAHSLGGHRRPSAFEAKPSMASFWRTTLAALFRPARFYGSLTPRPVGTGDAWFARAHRAVAAALLSVTVSGHLVFDANFKRWLMNALTPPGATPSYEAFTVDLYLMKFYWADEPALFGVLLVLLTVIAYVLIALATRLATGLASPAMARHDGQPQRTVALRALRFHSVHLVPVAFIMAATVGGPMSLQLTPLVIISWLAAAWFAVWRAARGATSPGSDSPRRGTEWRGMTAAAMTGFMTVIVLWYLSRIEAGDYDDIATRDPVRPRYLYGLAVEAVLAPAYLLITGWVAVRRMAYANDRPHEGLP